MATAAFDGDGRPHGGLAAIPKAIATTRLQSIDALRGFVMVVMLLDHVRETFFLHLQVGDPVDARTVMPALFFTRLLSTICAPVFVALTGLSAYLYGQKHSRAEVSDFLLRRGAFLLFLEISFVSFAWSAKFPPQTLWLQVIWAIGFSMICLAGAVHFSRTVIVALGLAIVCGHNLLDGIVLAPGDTFFVPWALLHQRAAFEFLGITWKTTYPVLPWIGLILLGYGIGPWFAKGTAPAVRQRRLVLLGIGLILGFVVLRWLNVYGDRPWYDAGTPLRTTISFLALTKYPASLLFLMPTVGIGALLLAAFERFQSSRLIPPLATFGGAPMFYYLVHLYILRAMYLVAFAIWGPTHGTVFALGNLGWIWAWYAGLIVALYFPTRWFAGVKQRRKDIWWLKYL
ncbi:MULTISPECIES: DUF1624 domain-containing protein [unclassified Sphingomonas]|uniref:DUF1624 domain-containing protein n=1 Tax=unclassified Sphingomonas TaxID=196159 RepID=UPI000701D0D8|nr:MULTISPECIES: heparan-alpha-glucosaminide N-acetyltransferase domain-containing protein [unclassified Sphingomonas]KQM66765.1 hypothetical protein ASE65_01375 [Sphingomonas sp. Leaf16]KQN17713.1 hypothetical protein ASE81_00755 [Sphingomonas sp. Leaf29]KQN23575.1 hypothetical protein ASE83_03635 [Sphingomonas sp. Leaf32]